jgi:diaminopimelate decarboxylase
VIFSGVGKSVEEMRLALSHDILCFNVESIPELHRLNEVAGAMGKKARISLRVNPNVDAKTHPYIATGLKANKFGVAFDDALDTYRTAPSCRTWKCRASTATSARSCWTTHRCWKRWTA